MSPPPRDLHVVPREEPESEPPNVVRMPPRPATAATLPYLADKIDALQVDSRECLFQVRRNGEAIARCEESIGACEIAIVSEILPWQARAGLKLEAIATTLAAIAKVVGEPGDPEAAARLSVSDMTQEQAEEAFKVAALGSGLCRRDAEREIREKQREHRIAKAAAKGASDSTATKTTGGVIVSALVLAFAHDPVGFVSAAASGWPGVALVALVIVFAAVRAALARRKGAP